MTNESSFWTSPRLCQLLGVLAMLPLAACTSSKSANVLSATVAGPIPGVDISAPSPVAPNDAAKVAVDNQPVTLMVNNASTSGPRPLGYHFEVATDANFTNPVFTRDDIAPGDAGRTSLKLPDPLAPDRTYYWRARAQDGANTGPFSSVAHFDVIVPVVLGAANLLSPINGVVVDSLRPRFTIGNAPRTGPANQISYLFQISDNDSFGNAASTTVGETPNQTTYEPPVDGQYNTQYFWRVQAQERTTVGPWSATQTFRTLLPPPPPPTAPAPGGGGGSNQAGHIAPGPLTEDRARQVVLGTAQEFPGLTAVFGSEGEAVGAVDELLRRTIWHLQLAGYQSGRQKNPSGAISSDKICIQINGSWHAYDIFSLGFAGRATTVQFIEVGSPNPQGDGGIPD